MTLARKECWISDPGYPIVRLISRPRSKALTLIGDAVAWDVVGDISFSQPLGYLDKGCDFDGTLAIADKATDYFSLVGCMPFLDYVLEKNPLIRPFISPRFARITGVSLGHLMDRYAGKDGGHHDASKPDYLDHFLEAKKLYPDVVDDAQIISCVPLHLVAFFIYLYPRSARANIHGYLLGRLL